MKEQDGSLLNDFLGNNWSLRRRKKKKLYQILFTQNICFFSINAWLILVFS